MDNDRFVALVGDMRKAQKVYFKNRNYDNLQKSKNLEKQVDDAIERLMDDGQQELFETRGFE
jgi:hypothetical protein